MRTPLVVMVVLGLALLGLDLAFGSSGDDAASSERAAPIAVIARRVETVRGLRYRSIPAGQTVSPAQARQDGLRDFDRSYPRARQEADEEMLKLLRLIPDDATMRQVASSLYEQGVAGYYDPRTKHLRVVRSGATSTRVLTETTLAHELTHALEDQRFALLGTTSEQAGGTDDAALAHLALIEGTATDVMERYMTRYFSPEQVLGGTLASAFADTGSMPPFLEAETLFPYTAGQQFVAELVRRAGGRWDLVNLADRVRPPASTEQVMHPERYLEADAPARVVLRVDRVLRPEWKRASAGTWGELQTRELLAASGGGRASSAAEGWGGDRWELWRSLPLPDDSCSTPCRRADVLVMRWSWDTARDVGEFATRLRRWQAEELRGQAGASAIAVRGRTVTLALAPNRATATRVAAG